MGTEPTGLDRLLFDRIVAALRSTGQYGCDFREADREEIAKVRALGQRAARSLGWKVCTVVSDPARREDRRVWVVVAVVESSPLHEELMRLRGMKAFERYIAAEWL